MAEQTPNPNPAGTPPAGGNPATPPATPLSGEPPANPSTPPAVNPPTNPPATPPVNPPPADPPKAETAVNPLDDPQNKESEPDFEVTPEKLVFPEGFNVVPEAAGEFAAFVKEQKLNVEQVNSVIQWYGQFAEKQAAAAREAEAANVQAYNAAVAAIPQEDLQYARQAVEKFAASHEDKAFLKKAFVAPAVLKVLAAAGRATAEHPFIQSTANAPAGNPLASLYQTSIQQGG